MVWPVSFRGNLKTSEYPFELGIFVHSKVFGIMIRSPILYKYCVENRVSHIFEALEDVIELIMLFKVGYPSINSCKNVWK